ncbi:MAG: UDP-N-acetylmuramoyl-tripeptide--D-alanyl-D-alanine ligase [Chitinophagaceae bacterium]
MTIEELYSIYAQYPSIQTDTRKLQKNDLFFALKGPNFNANKFALQALQQGAAYAIIDEPTEANNAKLILVDDVLNVLQQLAKHHRGQFNIPFIAITGSNGKTTTKELVHAVLSSKYKTYTTQGNLNNYIGVPLTILKIKKDAEIAVIEMGANHQREIEGYCKIAQPTHGIITNCGKAHLEGFGGVEGVRKAKGELYDYLKTHSGSAFAFDDYNYLHEMSKGIKNIFWYGTKKGELIGDVKQSEPFLEVAFTKGVSFSFAQTQLVGDYNLPNILCAVAVAKHFDVADEKIKSAVENYIPSNSRSQLIEIGTNKIILDAYNANPSSMKAAIENFAHLHAKNKILMLGAMMELGKESIAEHQALIHLINQYQWKNVVLVGGDFNKIKHQFIYFDNSLEAKKWLQQQHFENTYFLIKGSRSLMMEKVIEIAE